MCGNVSYIGAGNGVGKVLNALQLLEYRAPDSSGLALLGEDGRLHLRRTVGNGRQLRGQIAAAPLPPAAAPIVVGHGRWAMVGAVTVANAHPISDRSGSRVVCENGSHNASLMLSAMQAQEAWWHSRGLPAHEPAHRTENTSEVLTFAWERIAYLLADEETPKLADDPFTAQLDANSVTDREERALRLAV